MKKIILTASLLGGVLFQSGAQEFTVGINASQAGTRYTLPNGSTSLKPSAGLELGYQAPLTKRLNLLTGLEVFRYGSKATLADNTVYAHNQVDDMGSAFEYRVATTGYTEKQSLTALRIPLVLQLIPGKPVKTDWYINAGIKFMLPAKVKVAASAAQLTTAGYYPDVNAEVKDLPQHGFGTVNNWQSDSRYSLKSGWLATGGTGLSFKPWGPTGPKLYTGVYVDYGLNNMRSSNEPQSLVTYHPQNVSSVQANGVMSTAGVESVKLMNVGIQLKLGFGRKVNAPKK